MSDPRALADCLERLEDALDAGREPNVQALADELGLSVEAVRAQRDALLELRHFLEPAGDTPPSERPSFPGYVIGEEVGRGGMGVVYRAHRSPPADSAPPGDPGKSGAPDESGKPVAIKELLASGPPHAIERFRREAESLRRLDHENIVRIVDVGEEDERPYLVMEWVGGGTLDDRIPRRRPASRARGARRHAQRKHFRGWLMTRAVRWLREVARAVAHVHGEGLLHRDLKPSNVLVDDDGRARVVDFGLARDVEGTGSLTRTGEILGTPDYMAPEQILGDHDAVDERTDVYGLGAILYECLTGRAPFAHLGLAEKVHAIVHVPPIAPRRLDPRAPAALEAIALRALTKDPDARYPTAEAFDRDLARFEAGLRPTAPVRGLRVRLTQGLRTHARTVVIAGVALLLGLLGFWLVGFDSLGATPRGRLADGRALLSRGEAAAALHLFESAIEQVDALEETSVPLTPEEVVLHERETLDLEREPPALLDDLRLARIEALLAIGTERLFADDAGGYDDIARAESLARRLCVRGATGWARFDALCLQTSAAALLDDPGEARRSLLDIRKGFAASTKSDAVVHALAERFLPELDDLRSPDFDGACVLAADALGSLTPAVGSPLFWETRLLGARAAGASEVPDVIRVVRGSHWLAEETRTFVEDALTARSFTWATALEAHQVDALGQELALIAEDRASPPRVAHLALRCLADVAELPVRPWGERGELGPPSGEGAVSERILALWRARPAERGVAGWWELLRHADEEQRDAPALAVWLHERLGAPLVELDWSTTWIGRGTRWSLTNVPVPDVFPTPPTSDLDALQGWWRASSDRDAAELLTIALGLETDLEFEDALARLRAAPGFGAQARPATRRARRWLHELASLLAPAGVTPPAWPYRPGVWYEPEDLMGEWRAAVEAGRRGS